MSVPSTEVQLHCDAIADGWNGEGEIPCCPAPSQDITYIDIKGYAYCRKHGIERKDVCRCRQLRPSELAKLRRGEPLTEY